MSVIRSLDVVSGQCRSGNVLLFNVIWFSLELTRFTGKLGCKLSDWDSEILGLNAWLMSIPLLTSVLHPELRPTAGQEDCRGTRWLLLRILGIPVSFSRFIPGF